MFLIYEFEFYQTSVIISYFRSVKMLEGNESNFWETQLAIVWLTLLFQDPRVELPQWQALPLRSSMTHCDTTKLPKQPICLGAKKKRELFNVNNICNVSCIVAFVTIVTDFWEWLNKKALKN